MSVEEILSKGFYRQGQTFRGEEWKRIPLDWKKYILLGENSTKIEYIEAKDDETAIKAFRSLYDIENMDDPRIFEEIVTHREIYFVD